MGCLSLLFAASLHLGLENKYNNLHPHTRCQVDSVISGIYYNSEDNISSYIGLEHNGWELGLVTGYESRDVLPMIRYKKNNWFITPAYENDDTYGIVIGWEIRLK